MSVWDAVNQVNSLNDYLAMIITHHKKIKIADRTLTSCTATAILFCNQCDFSKTTTSFFN